MAGPALSHHWSEAEALEARDRAFDGGARSLHVASLPLRLAAAGFGPETTELPILDA